MRKTLLLIALVAGLVTVPFSTTASAHEYDWRITVKTGDGPPPGCGGIADGNVVTVHNDGSPHMDCDAAVKVSQMAVGDAVYTESRDTPMFADSYWTVTGVVAAGKPKVDPAADASLVAKLNGVTYTISLDAAPYVVQRDYRFLFVAKKELKPGSDCGALVDGSILRSFNGDGSQQSCPFNRKLPKIELGDVLHTHGGGAFWNNEYWEVTNIATGKREQAGTDDATFVGKHDGTVYTISAHNVT